MKNCIYRFLDKDNNIIYIGKAKDLKNRLNGHYHLPQKCYKERVNIEFIEFETEDEMDFAERYYIPKYKPKYNKIMSNRIINISLKEFDNKQWINIKNIKRDNKIKENKIKDDCLDCRLQELAIQNEIKRKKEFEKNKNRKIINLSTGEIFNNIQDFKDFSNTFWSIDKLLDYCNGEKIFLDIKHPNYYATSMLPAYLDEFEKKHDIKDWEYQFMKHTRKIICLTTEEVFENSYKVQDTYGHNNVIRCCNGLSNYTGSYDNKPMVYKWYDEYINMDKQTIKNFMDKAYYLFSKRNKQ